MELITLSSEIPIFDHVSSFEAKIGQREWLAGEIRTNAIVQYESKMKYTCVFSAVIQSDKQGEYVFKEYIKPYVKRMICNAIGNVSDRRILFEDFYWSVDHKTNTVTGGVEFGVVDTTYSRY